MDRLTGETTPQGTVNYGYDAAGRRTRMTVAGVTAVTYGYDNANRLTSLTQGSSTVGFAYDVANRRTQLTLPNGVSMNYGYDTANQLTSITYKKGTTSLGDLGYSYDNAGRRTQVTGSYARTGLPAALTGVYDAANRMTQFNGTTLTYNTNGSLQFNGTFLYIWDAANRLKSYSNANGTNAGTFSYDALGRRSSKTINGFPTGYLYDGLNPVQELTGSTPKANMLTGLHIDEFFQRTDSITTSYPLTDAARPAPTPSNTPAGKTTAGSTTIGQDITMPVMGGLSAVTRWGWQGVLMFTDMPMRIR